MQLAATTNTTPAARPDFRGITLGTVNRHGENWVLSTASTTRNTVLGAATGYASLDDAITAARSLTAGRASAAAVLGSTDRFFLKEVVFSAWTGNDYAYDGIGSHKERGFFFQRAELKALVDGDTVVRAGKLGEHVPFTR